MCISILPTNFQKNRRGPCGTEKSVVLRGLKQKFQEKKSGKLISSFQDYKDYRGKEEGKSACNYAFLPNQPVGLVNR